MPNGEPPADSTSSVKLVAVWCIVMSPAVVLPGGLFRFTLPTLAVAVLGVLLAAWAPRQGRLPRSVVVVTAAGVLVLLVAALASPAPIAQLVGRWPRYEGLVALPVYLGAVWAGARLLGPGGSARSARAAVLATATSIVLIAGFAVAESVGLRPLGGDVTRPGGLLGNATDQGIVGMLSLAVLLPVAVAGLPGRIAAASGWVRAARSAPGPLRVAATVGALGAASTVILSGSRGAMLGSLVALGVETLVMVRSALGRRNRTMAVLTGTLLAALLITFAMALPATRDRITATEGPAAQTVQGRWLLWSETIRLVANRPLTGVGPSGFVDAIPDLHSREWALTTDAENPPDSPHSWPLQAAAGGLPLLALALALALLVLTTGWRRVVTSAPTAGPATNAPRTDEAPDAVRWLLLVGALGGVVGYGVALTTHFTTAGTAVLAGLLAGALIAASPRPTGVRPSRDTWATSVRGFAAAWLVLLTLASSAELVLNRAVVLAARGEVDAAEADFLLAQRLRPWDLDIPLIAAQTFVAGAHAGHQPSAVAASTWAGAALTATPMSLEAARIRAVAWIALDEPDRAEMSLSRLLDRSPYDSRLLLARGVAHARSGEWAAAEQDLVLATTFAPNDPIAWQNLAIVYSATGQEEAALAAERSAEDARERTGTG